MMKSRFEDEEYREWQRALPCLKCIEEFDIELAPIYQNECAHDRIETDGGMGMRPSDIYSCPLCHEHHAEQHRVGAITFWGGNMRAMKKTCLALYEAYDKSDYMPAIEVLEEYKEQIK